MKQLSFVSFSLIVNTLLIYCQDASTNGEDTSCSKWSYECMHSKECIPFSWVCDGEADCGQYHQSEDGQQVLDMSDELNCPSQNGTTVTIEDNKCNSPDMIQCPGGNGTLATCILYERICDGKSQCPADLDESGDCNEKKNICKAVKCPEGQHCVFDFHGNPLCLCERANGKKKNELCFDVNDCHETCAHQCVVNRTKSLWPEVTCKCRPGYQSDQSVHCVAINDPVDKPPLLIVHQLNQLQVSSLDNKHLNKLDLFADDFIKRLQQAPNNLSIRSYDFNYDNNTICLVYSRTARVGSTLDNPPSSGILCTQLPTWNTKLGLTRTSRDWWWYQLGSPFSTEEVNHLAYEWYSHNWYLLGQDRIFACDDHFSHCVNILDAGDAFTKVASFALDPPAGFMYIAYQVTPSDSQVNSPSIYRYRLDGSEPSLLLDLGQSKPINLIIDLARQRLQWFDFRQQSIFKYDLIAGRLLPKIKFSPSTFKDYEIELLETFPALRDLFRLGVKMKMFYKVLDMVKITFVHRQLQPKLGDIKNSCDAKQKQCQHICAFKPQNGSVDNFKCLCSPGYNFMANGECIKKNYQPPIAIYVKDSPSVVKVIDQLNETIMMTKADDIAVMPGEKNAKFVAIDYDHQSNRIYYSDVLSFEIRYHTLFGGDGNMGKKERDQAFVTRDIIRAESIAVDWQGGNLYWIDSGLAEISVASLKNASHRVTLIKEKLSFPKSLALFHRGRYLFWSDWGKDNDTNLNMGSIERAQMDGESRQIVVDKDLKFPIALTVDANNDHLYWCDSAFHFRLERINFDGTNRLILYRSNVGRPYSMAFYRQALYIADHRGLLINRFDLKSKTLATWLQEDRPILDLKMIDVDFENGTFEPEMCTSMGCDHLCLVRPIGGPVCRCSNGFKLRDGKKCEAIEGYVPPPFSRPGRPECPDGNDDCQGSQITEAEHIECRQPNRTCRDRQTNETICLPVTKLCDNRQDCAEDNKDEGGMCSDDVCFFSRCQGLCRNTPDSPGFVCICPVGSKLESDGLTCTLADPCDWGTCSQRCETTKPYHHKCSCFDGYQLDPKDLFTCKSTAGVPALMIFSQRHELRLINLQTQRKSILRVDLKNAVAIDYLWRPSGEVVVYWADALEDKIFRGDLLQANTLINVETVAEGGLTSVEGLAIDWIAGNIYWVDSDFDRIEVAQISGKNRKTLITENVDGPRAISLDPSEATMFWTDWHATAPRIEAASMDGQQRRIVVRVKPGSWPNGLTLDLMLKRIYWIDAKSDEMNTVRYDGSDLRRILVNSEYLTHPFAISLYENEVYWTDWTRSALVKASKWNGTGLSVLSIQLEKPFDVKIIHPSRQPKVKDEIGCAHNNGNCSHLCLLSNVTATGRRFSCTCPHTMRLLEDNRTCILNEVFLLVGRQSEVRGVDLEDSKNYILPPISLPKVLSPVQIDFIGETKEIFWADSQFNEIKKFSLIDGKIETVIDAIIQQPTTFAVDWMSKNMYIVSKNVHDHVTLFNHDHEGEHRIDNMKTSDSSPMKGGHFDYIDTENEEDHYARMLELFGEEESVAAGHLRKREVEEPSKKEKNKATLYLCNLRGEYLSDITPSVNFTNPRSLALDPYHGRLYWAEHVEGPYGFSSTIMMARLDGTQPMQLTNSSINRELNKPASLQVDHYHNQTRLYWVNLETKSIQYLELDFANPSNVSKKLVTFDNNNGWATFEPYALTIFGNKLFVAYSDEETIRVMDKIKGDNDKIFLSEVTDGLSLRLYDAKIQKMGIHANLCSKNNGGCEQLCVMVSALKRTCLCAMGFQRVKTDETRCQGAQSFLMYSYSWGLRAISTVAPLQYENLPLHEQARKLASLTVGKDKSLLPIMSKILMASAIDFDARLGMIIWSDSDDNSISTIRRDSSGFQRLLVDAEHLGDFTYDWNVGNLYWFERGRIFMVNIWNATDSLSVRTEQLLIVPAGDAGDDENKKLAQIGPLNSITIHPGLGKIYWTSQSPTDRSLVYIEQANLDGTNRRVLVEKRKSAFGDLVVDFVDHYLYFTESNEKLVERIPLQHPELATTSTLKPTIVARGIKNPVSLAVDNVHLYWSDIHHFGGAIFKIKRPNEEMIASNWTFSINATDVKLLERGIGDHLKDLNIYQQRPIYRQNPCTQSNGNCEQYCFYLGVPHQHQCGCAYGYISANDGLSCEEYDVFAFFSYDNKIESIKVIEHERSETVKTAHSNKAPYKTIELARTLPPEGAILAHDYNRQRLFYARSQVISWCFFNGTNHQIILQPMMRIEQMIYEPKNGYLFWRSDRVIKKLLVSGLERRSLNVSDNRMLANMSQVLTILDLNQWSRIRLGPMAVDQCTGTLYWSNVHIERPSIYRMLNDKNSLLILDKDVVHFPVAMLVDAGRWLYWTDGVYRTIMRCNLFGAECLNLAMETSSVGAYTNIPRHYLTIHNNWLHWVTIGGGLYRLNLKTKKQMLWKQLETSPTGFVLVAPYLNNQTLIEHCVASRDLCSHKNGGCDDFCFNGRNGTTVQCACYEGRVLAEDQRRCLDKKTDCLEERGMFECRRTAQCIPYELTCDNVKHCFDGTDEDGWMCATRQQCPKDKFFTCASNGRCVPLAKRCNSVVDCSDSSDEIDCPCDGKFKCHSDNVCIDSSLQCNNRFDCRDGSDEQNCSARECPESMVACLNLTQQCVYITQLCDNFVTCLDETDEIGNCEAFQEKYQISAKTIERNRENRPKVSIVNNGTTIIREEDHRKPAVGEDDVEECGDEQFRCKTGECIAAYFACDGNTDCQDGSDEQHTMCQNRTCPTAHYKCNFTGQCIPRLWMCDHEKDCFTDDDEMRYDAVSNQTVPCDQNRKIITSDFTDLEDLLGKMDGLLCKLKNHFQCRNRRCVPLKALCDGRDDCTDGSDETLPECSTTNFTCPDDHHRCRDTSRCIPKLWLCNGIRDCPKNDDESNVVCGKANNTDRACGDRFECDNGVCIDAALICNGDNDCADFSDEKSCNLNECQVYERACAQKCEDLPILYRCSCFDGFTPIDGGRVCEDIDECSERLCSQKCLNKYGSFECSCVDGYRLDKDGRTCRSTEVVQPKLIVTTHHSIIKAETDSLEMKLEQMNLKETDMLLNGSLTNAVGVDFDWQESCLYWSEITAQHAFIKRFCQPEFTAGVEWQPTNDSMKGIKVLHSTTLSSPDGLAIDWIGRNLYWCDKGRDTIEVSKLDGTLRRVLIRHGLDEPRAIVVNPLEGIMFWSDWGDRPHIGRANMDGTSVKIILDESLGWPNALTIDFVRRELYFADAQLDYIAVIDFNGKRRVVIFDGDQHKTKFTNHIFAMSVFETRLYWTDWHSKALVSCPVMNCTKSNLFVHLVTVHRPMDVKVFHKLRQPPLSVKNPCSGSDDPRSCRSLCLLRPKNETKSNKLSKVISVEEPKKLESVCACPENFALNDDGATCHSNCSKSDFVCQNTYKCIPFFWVCDTQDDCGDGSDEPEWCPPFHCQPGQYQCRTKALECIQPAQICDGTKQCSDGTDEHECDDYQCLSTQFKCPRTTNRTSYCITASARCDGIADCLNGEDERDCECPSTAFKCSNNRCISKEWICDGDDDCGNNSDESKTLCSELNCTAGEFRCHNGPCIPITWRCDQDPDCIGQDDERDCDELHDNRTTTCSENQFRCGNGQCIYLFYKCDMDDDCMDGSDERDCPIHRSNTSAQSHGCKSHEFQCAPDSLCIPEDWRCDGQLDCPNGHDETQCEAMEPGLCQPGEFRCANGLCIIDQWRCDGEPDCVGDDRSDETPEMCLKSCPPHRFRCFQATNSSELTNLDPKCYSQQQICERAQECAHAESLCLAMDTLMCASAPGPLEKQKINKFECSNGACLDASVRCDGRDDCGNGSDEQDCETVHRRFHIDCPFGLCSQGCVEKKRHKQHGKDAKKELAYRCECAPGYSVVFSKAYPDSIGCRAVGSQHALFISEISHNINFRLFDPFKWFDTMRFGEPDTTHQIARVSSWRLARSRSVDVLYHNKTAFSVFWANFFDRKIAQITVNDVEEAIHHANKTGNNISKASTFMTDVTAASMAVDWVAGHLYWFENTTKLMVTKVKDGQKKTTLVAEGFDRPDDLVVDPKNFYLYWTDWSEYGGRIMRSALDGTRWRTLVHGTNDWPLGLVLDLEANYLYWSDPKTRVIQAVRVDGADRRLIHSFKTTKGEESLQPGKLAMFEDSIYVAMFNTLDIYRLNKFGRVLTEKGGERMVKISRQRKLAAMNVVHHLKQRPLPTPCVTGDKHHCPGDALCLALGPQEYRCKCPDHYETSSTGACKPKTKQSTSRPPSTETCPCLNGGRCRINSTDESIFCECNPLFSGKLCEQFRCAGHCRNNGLCYFDLSDVSEIFSAPGDVGAKRGEARCMCHTGWMGENCSKRVQRCDEDGVQICYNNATCSKLDTDRFHCNCLEGFGGDECERCVDWGVCKNGGVCARNASNGRPQCQCRPGFGGEKCEQHLCSKRYCHNNGVCTLDTLPNWWLVGGGSGGGTAHNELYPLPQGMIRLVCQCSQGYTGERCNEIASFNTSTTPATTTSSSDHDLLPSCMEHQCHNNGRCHVTKASKYRPFCECLAGFSGEHCEIIEENINVDGEEAKASEKRKRIEEEIKARDAGGRGTSITVYILLTVVIAISAGLVAFRFHDSICKKIQSNLAFQHRRIDDQSMISLNETGSSRNIDIMNPIFDGTAADGDDDGATVRIYGNGDREFVVDYKNTNFANPVYENQAGVSEEEERANLLVSANETEK